MSRPKPPPPAKLVVGLLMKERDLLDPVVELLDGHYGPVDMVSEWLRFDYTDYYESEMGGPLSRRVLAFKPLVESQTLPEIKATTNGIEARFARDGRRRVNIDPGYLTAERLVLATGKNFTHRIYLDRGIYADLTLIYTRGGFQSLPWTYPDYAGTELKGFFTQVRQKYQLDLKGGR